MHSSAALPLILGFILGILTYGLAYALLMFEDHIGPTVKKKSIVGYVVLIVLDVQLWALLMLCLFGAWWIATPIIGAVLAGYMLLGVAAGILGTWFVRDLAHRRPKVA